MNKYTKQNNPLGYSLSSVILIEFTYILLASFLTPNIMRTLKLQNWRCHMKTISHLWYSSFCSICKINEFHSSCLSVVSNSIKLLSEWLDCHVWEESCINLSYCFVKVSIKHVGWKRKKGSKKWITWKYWWFFWKVLIFNWNVLFPSIINFKTSEIQCSKHSSLKMVLFKTESRWKSQMI